MKRSTDALAGPAARWLRWLRFGPCGFTTWQAYLFAIAASAIAVQVRLTLGALWEAQSTSVIFTVTIMWSAYFGGWRAGLLATALSYFAMSNSLFPPLRHFPGAHWEQFLVVLAGVVISLLSRALHRSRERADLTVQEYQRADDRKRESDQRFSSAFEHAPIGMALVSLEGQWLSVNRALCQLSGYSEPELLARTFQDITHPEDLAFDLEFARQTLAGEIPSYQIQKRYVHARGHTVTALLSVSLIRNAGGDPSYFIAQVQDITQRQRAEVLLRESEERFRQMAENITDVFWTASIESQTVHYVSPSYESIWARSIADLYANREHWLDAILDEDRAAVCAWIAKLRSGATEIGMEYRIARPDGSVRWIHDRGFQVRDEAGKVIRLTGVASDITDRKLADEALRSRDAHYAAAQRIAHFGSWEMELNGSSPSSTSSLHWSDELFRIAGYSRDAVALSPAFFFGLVPSAEQESIRTAVATAIRERKEYSVVHRLVRPDGEERTVLEVGQVSFDEKTGRPLKIIGTTHDITEQRRAEESIRAQAHMLNHVGRAVIATDPGGLITYANRFAEEVYGWSAAEMLGRPVVEVTPAKTTREQAKQIMVELKQGKSWSGEFLVRHRDGSEFPIATTVTSFRDQHGAVIGLVGISENISRRKQTEQALAELSERTERRERMKNTLLSAITDFAYIYDQNGRFLFANQSFLNFWGLTLEELVSRDLQQVGLREELAGRLLREIREVFATGRSVTGEMDHPSAAGESGFYEYIFAPVFASDGGVELVVGSTRDITQRKKYEAAVRESEERFSGAFEFAPIGVALVSPEGQWLKVNRAVCDLVGYSSAELLAGTFQEITHPEDLQGDLKEMNRLLRGEIRSYQIEKRYVHQSGNLVTVWLHVSLVRDCAGEPVYFISQLQDITERKRMEEELSQSRETLRAILDHIPQRVFWKDRDLVYRGCNQAFAVDMGFHDPSEVIGRTDFEGPWKAIAHLYRDDDRKVIELDTPISSFEEPGVVNGRPRWFRTSKVPLHDRSGRVTAVLGTYEDVTAYKLASLEIEQLNSDLERRVAQRTEALLAATEEAERANRAKSDFLSRISHELRTPMNAILGFAQVLEIEENLTTDQRESISQIVIGGAHLLKLINEVLDISSIEAGGMTLSLETVAVQGLLEESINLLRPLTLEFSVRFTVILRESAGYVRADRQRLKQVLLNLLGNAIKFNCPGGNVTVRCIPPAADVAGAGKFTRILITDTGAGISAEKQARLFNPFDRLGAEQTRVEGTGLGLALAKLMVEHMGGTLGVESVVGEGSTFWVELPTVESPVEEESVEEAILPAVPQLPTEKRVLLYIEDNPSNTRLMTRILSRRPVIQLLSATSGEAGLQMAQDHHPDLILLDLHLPDIQGDQVLKQLRADPCTSGIPVVVVTADALTGKREQMLAAGARNFLTKPIEVRAVLGALDDVFAL